MGTLNVRDCNLVVFDWDEVNIRHLARHSVSPVEAEQSYFSNPLLIEEQWIQGESRYLALGETQASRRLAFVFTVWRDKVRFVTAYPMTVSQQELYEEG